MDTTAEMQGKTIAVVRIAVGLLFILFGQFKAFGPEFMGGMQTQQARSDGSSTPWPPGWSKGAQTD